MSLQKRFFRKLDSMGISQNRAAQMLGVSSAVISGYKNSSYMGDVSALEIKIQDWLSREDSRAKLAAIPFTRLSNTGEIDFAIESAYEDKDISVIYGEAGTGKTTALRSYVEDRPLAYLVEVDTSYTKNILVREIAKAVGLDWHGSVSEICSRIISNLKPLDAVVIFDEAERLSTDKLDLIRRVVCDKAECGVVLCGLPGLRGLISENYRDMKQIQSRVGFVCSVGRMTEHDCAALVTSVFPEADADSIAEFYRSSLGSIRTLSKLVKLTKKIMAANCDDRARLEYVKAANKKIMAR